MNDQPRRLGGRYELGEVIGRGGMATVRRARDTRLGRDVAVKELRLDLATDHIFQARFRREAQSAAGLNHPNIVAVYDTGEELDPTGTLVPYIVMELVEGRTLRDLLRSGRPIQPRKALEFTQGVLDALEYSHKAGIVHRDIKPANVMLTNGGLVKVMDFGIARAVADTSATMTQTAAVIGTAQYLSPEQARGETVDARSDIYSAGCLMYELLTGRPPFVGDSPVSVAYQHVREEPVAPSQVDPTLTPGMDSVVLKALAKDPADRYQTALDMRLDISRVIAGRQPLGGPVAPVGTATQAIASAPTQALPPATTAMPAVTEVTYGGGTTADYGPPQRGLPPEEKSRRGLWIGLLIALVVLLVGGGAVLLMMNREPAIQQVAVPNVFNELESVAVEKIKMSQLEPVVTHVNGPNDETVGRVTAQNPPRDQLVLRDSKVAITVNAGPEEVIVPDGLEGRPFKEVESILRDLQLSPRPVAATDEPPDARADTVLRVEPGAGETVFVGQTINVTVATGRARVPELRNLTKDEATREAARFGFESDVLKWETRESASDTPGLVITTRPGAGTLVSKTDPLVVIIAKAPPKPTVQPSTEQPTSPEESPSPDEEP